MLTMKALTSKQQAFVDAIIAGSNQSDAYRQAYDAEGMLPTTIADEAYNLATRPDIAPIIEQGKARLATRKEWTLDRILDKAERGMNGAEEDHAWSPYFTGLTLIGQATGLVSKTVKVEHSGSVDTPPSLEHVLALIAIGEANALKRGLPDPFAEATPPPTALPINKQWQQPPSGAKTVEADDYQVSEASDTEV